MLRLFKKKKKDPQKLLKELLDGYELPNFPRAVMNALKKLRNIDIPLKEVAHEIEKDPGMHIMVLQYVNSAAFGLCKKVSNVGHAVNLLGRSRLESLILPLAVKESMPNFKAPCLNLKKFWYTSGFRASLARRIAEEVHPATIDDSFTAALLQDMAIPVLIAQKKEEYCLTLEKWDEENGVKLPELERAHFGFDHQTVGGLMAEQWEFPPNLKLCIEAHHDKRPNPEVPNAVKLVASIRYLNGSMPEQEVAPLIEKCTVDFGISDYQLKKMVKQAMDEANEMANLMN